MIIANCYNKSRGYKGGGILFYIEKLYFIIKDRKKDA